MDELEKQVCEFIKRRFFGFDQKYWNTGNCYYFAVILKDRFGFDIYYDQIEGHFVAGYVNNDNMFLFDYNGRYYPKDGSILTVSQIQKDNNWWSRLVRDCLE